MVTTKAWEPEFNSQNHIKKVETVVHNLLFQDQGGSMTTHLPKLQALSQTETETAPEE